MPYVMSVWLRVKLPGPPRCLHRDAHTSTQISGMRPRATAQTIPKQLFILTAWRQEAEGQTPGAQKQVQGQKRKLEAARLQASWCTRKATRSWRRALSAETPARAHAADTATHSCRRCTTSSCTRFTAPASPSCTYRDCNKHFSGSLCGPPPAASGRWRKAPYVQTAAHVWESFQLVMGDLSLLIVGVHGAQDLGQVANSTQYVCNTICF